MLHRCRYVQLDDALVELTRMVKLWAANRQLMGSSRGYLNGYAWTLMVVYFMQSNPSNYGPLPALQQIPPLGEQLCPRLVRDGCDVYFSHNLEQLSMAGIEPVPVEFSPERLYRLLFDFCFHFAFEFNPADWVMSVRVGVCLSKVSKGWRTQELGLLHFFAIEDPMDPDVNVAAGLEPAKYERMRREFVRAYRLLNDAHGFRTMFEKIACEPTTTVADMPPA
jgi:DNA polymerase sigma